jgi:hypothetical protein
MENFGQFEIFLTIEFAILGTFLFVNLVNISTFIWGHLHPKKINVRSNVKKIASSSNFAIKKKKLWALSAFPIKSKIHIKKPKVKIIYPKMNFTRLLIFNLVATGTFLGILYYLFNPGAKVLSTYPLNNQALLDYEKPIEIVFDRPIRKEVLEIYMSNNIEGEWEYVKSFSFLPFVRTVKFHPKESFFPSELIKLYIVNFNKKDIGEYPLDFYSAELPEITSVTPTDKQKDLFPDQKITVKINKRQGNYVNWEFKLKPDTEIKVEQKSPTEFILTPVNGLKQTTDYTVEVYRTPQTFNLTNDQVVQTGKKVKVHESKFSTVKAPLVESYIPEGTGILPSATVKVVFDESMIHDEVEKSF